VIYGAAGPTTDAGSIVHDRDTAPRAGSGPIDSVNAAAEDLLRELTLAPRTRQTYRYGLRALVRYLHAARGNARDGELMLPAQVSWIDEETLAGFFVWLREKYPDQRLGETGASRTARTYLVAARRLMNWLDLRGLLPEGVSYDRMLRRVEAGRGRRRQSYLQRPTDPDIFRVVTHYLRQELPEGPQARLTLLRNRALVVTLYDTAMRVSEALALTRADVLDGRARKVRLTRTKNGRPRTVFLSPKAREALQAYCAEREDGLNAALFVSHGRRAGRPITARTAWQVVKRAAVAEGLYANTSPHALRHGRAQRLLDNGMPLEWVSSLLGHEHVDTTRIVYAFETDEEQVGALVARYGAWPEQEGERSEGDGERV